MSYLIITRPQHDVTTRYLASWAEEVIFLAKDKGIQIIDLEKNKANRKELEGRIKKLSPRVIFLNGHGDDDCITGHDNKILIKADDNHEVLNGKITYALSCNSGKILGAKVAENENSTYIGYTDEFIFICDTKYVSRPLDDRMAKPFKESSNQVIISLLKGHNAAEASERSVNYFKTNCLKLLASTADADSRQAAQFLWWNMRNQVCLGDGNARI